MRDNAVIGAPWGLKKHGLRAISENLTTFPKIKEF